LMKKRVLPLLSTLFLGVLTACAGPPNQSGNGHNHNHDNDYYRDHYHSHDHEHYHSHNHGHNHEHSHNHNHGHNHEHSHNHNHSHGHNHGDLQIVGDAGILNIYSSRHFDADELIFIQFAEETGIGVNVIHASSGEFVQRLIVEGENTQADLIIAADGGILNNAKNHGLLQPVDSEVLNNNIPEHLRDANNYWHAMSYRARIIAYSNDRIESGQITTYQDLASPEFENSILIRPANNIYNISLLASLIEIYGDVYATDWARGVVENRARNPQGNDRDQIIAISAGIGSLALINTYYLGLLLNSMNQEEVRAYEDVNIVFPNQETTGTHVNISGMAVTAHASNRDNAIRFMEFITEVPQQEFITNNNFEYPVNPNARLNPLLASWGDFNKQEINFMALAENNIRSIEILNSVGWN